MNRTSLQVTLLCLFGAVIGFYFLRSPKEEPLYINQSSEHSFDRSLKGTLKIARKKTGIEYAVILLAETPKTQTLEALAYQYFQEYKVGSKTGGKGILLVFSQNPAQMKIEVSRNLEGVFPDIVCSGLEEAAKSFVMKGNIRNYIAEFIITSGLYYLKDPMARSAQNFTQSKSELALSISAEDGGLTRLSAGAGVLSRNYQEILERAYSEVKRDPTSASADFLPSENAGVTAQRYLASLGNGVVSSKMPLLTLGSQFFRLESPKTADFLKRNYRYYQEAGPFSLHESGALAVALYPAGNPVWPILLIKNTQGQWLVDEAKTWAYFHQFEDSNDFQPKYRHAYHFAWQEAHHPLANHFVYDKHAQAAPLIGEPNLLLEKIKLTQNRLKNDPKNSQRYFELADLFYFEMYWTEEAKRLVKEGLTLDPDNLPYLWRMVELDMNTDDIDGFLLTMQKIIKLNPSDLSTRAWYLAIKEIYE